ncbi:glycolipid transfer protein [Rhinolophus ferrumequinum]|uniref:Glycolipid transfer protein n=1 Tax=Rhinolophus ferrumequinum TaxID=59479 RepID=A0A7J7RPR9_RHIFE|nr:glycolipid transfer protein [Rhinolophus ferrumequinum]
MALLAEHLLKPLPADKQIETGPFLEAVSHLPPFFDCLGSPVFTPIKADISGNITKIKAVYDTDPAKFRTLQNILEVEKEMYGAEWPKVGATLALMWLKRGLRFIQVFLQSICDGERDESHPNHIRVNATKAYEMHTRAPRPLTCGHSQKQTNLNHCESSWRAAPGLPATPSASQSLTRVCRGRLWFF